MLNHLPTYLYNPTRYLVVRHAEARGGHVLVLLGVGGAVRRSGSVCTEIQISAVFFFCDSIYTIFANICFARRCSKSIKKTLLFFLNK